MKVAIVHYWLDSFRGGEKVIEAICELFPEADIYTHIYNPKDLPDSITSHNIKTTIIHKLPFASKLYRYYLPLMPLALKLLNLKKYDLIISSESGPAKDFRKRSDAIHVCYCHSPMRYIRDMQKDYTRQMPFILRGIWSLIACYIRKWDYASAQKVDYFISNSNFISARIRKFYKRKSIVIHPPVDISKFTPGEKRGNFYLCAAHLVHYKKIDIVVKAFNELELPLVVIGGGSKLKKIQSIAKNNIQISGRVSDAVLKEKMETCKAFVYAGKEDFGIVFAEAQAAGAPVIAYRKGGIKDIVIHNKTGLFFSEQTVAGLVNTIRSFEKQNYNLDKPINISERMARFSKEKFKEDIYNFINSNCLSEKVIRS